MFHLPKKNGYALYFDTSSFKQNLSSDCFQCLGTWHPNCFAQGRRGCWVIYGNGNKGRVYMSCKCISCLVIFRHLHMNVCEVWKKTRSCILFTCFIRRKQYFFNVLKCESDSGYWPRRAEVCPIFPPLLIFLINFETCFHFPHQYCFKFKGLLIYWMNTSDRDRETIQGRVCRIHMLNSPEVWFDLYVSTAHLNDAISTLSSLQKTILVHSPFALIFESGTTIRESTTCQWCHVHFVVCLKSSDLFIWVDSLSYNEWHSRFNRKTQKLAAPVLHLLHVAPLYSMPPDKHHHITCKRPALTTRHILGDWIESRETVTLGQEQLSHWINKSNPHPIIFVCNDRVRSPFRTPANKKEMAMIVYSLH